MTTAADAKRELKRYATAKRAKSNAWFFKTGKGEYGEGDKFLGVRVPDIRRTARACKDLSIRETERLVHDPLHEVRLLGLLIWTLQYPKADNGMQEKIYRAYRKAAKQGGVNNWDLVDSSAHKIVGPHLEQGKRQELVRLAKSQNLWEQRIAIIATYHYIKQNDFTDTLKIAKLLLGHEHDLIHKAVGWMLREVGNQNRAAEERFLKQHYARMPRTMLRYAIEKFPESRRKAYLAGNV